MFQKKRGQVENKSPAIYPTVMKMLWFDFCVVGVGGRIRTCAIYELTVSTVQLQPPQVFRSVYQLANTNPTHRELEKNLFLKKKKPSDFFIMS